MASYYGSPGGNFGWLAQGVRPVDINPLIPLQRQAQLGELQAQQQERMAQAQTLQAQAQERQAAFQDQQGLRQAFIETKGDWDQIPQLAAQYGVRPAAIQAGVAANEKIITDRMKNSQDENALTISHHDQLRGELAGIGQLPPDQQPAAIQDFWGDKNKLWATGERDRAFQTFGNLADPNVRAALDATLNTGSKAAEEANARLKTQSETAQADAAVAEINAKLPGLQAESARKQLVTAAMKAATNDPKQGSAAIDTALPPSLDQQANAGYKAAWQSAMGLGNTELAAQIVKTAADHGASLSPAKMQADARKAQLEAQATAGTKVAVAGAEETARQRAIAAQMDQQNPTAQAIAEYRMAPPSPRSLATPGGVALMNQVQALNPDFDATQFPNRQKTRQAFTTGQQGQQINAMNTAIGHLDQMSQAVGALNNGNVQVVNAGKNWLKTQLGDPSVTNFDTLKVAVSGELASVLKRTGATDAEIKSVESTIKSSNSPAQLQGYIDTQIPIMGSKLSSLNYQYHQAMGAKDPFQALSPEAKGVLQNRGFDPDNPQIKGAGAGAGRGGSYKAGDTRTINGKNYVRDANGLWTAQ